MNPKKSGTVFIVLMISLIAFGVSSTMNIADIGTNLGVGLIPSNLSFSNQQQITAIGDPSFEPAYINKHIIINTTNTTNNTTAIISTNNTTNTTVNNSTG